jgi:hypothetical protein
LPMGLLVFLRLLESQQAHGQPHLGNLGLRLHFSFDWIHTVHSAAPNSTARASGEFLPKSGPEASKAVKTSTTAAIQAANLCQLGIKFLL